MAEKTKRKIVQITELHRRLGRFIRKVALSDEHFVVEKGGLPVAVIVSMPEYKRLTREQGLKDFYRLARSLGREAEEQGLTEEQLMAELDEDKRAMYEETYGND